jgi:hypothetical protein
MFTKEELQIMLQLISSVKISVTDQNADNSYMKLSSLRDKIISELNKDESSSG